MPRGQRRRDLTVVRPIRVQGGQPGEEHWLTRLAIVLSTFERMEEDERSRALHFIRDKYPELRSP